MLSSKIVNLVIYLRVNRSRTASLFKNIGRPNITSFVEIGKCDFFLGIFWQCRPPIALRTDLLHKATVLNNGPVHR